jgi:hypothetical protein
MALDVSRFSASSKSVDYSAQTGQPGSPLVKLVAWLRNAGLKFEVAPNSNAGKGWSCPVHRPQVVSRKGKGQGELCPPSPHQKLDTFLTIKNRHRPGPPSHGPMLKPLASGIFSHAANL